MLSYAKVAHQPRILRSLTGLTVREFEDLSVKFAQAWQAYIEARYINAPRRRAYGGGRKPQLQDNRDKLLFILLYFRLYPTQEVQGFLFGIGQAQAHEWVHKLTGILNQALGKAQQLPEREPLRLEAVLKACPSLDFIIDGTERRTCRPKDKEARKDYYSGKKKAHTVKNNLITERGGKVVFLSDTYAGRVHDKAICDGEAYAFPPGTQLWQDLGFQGYRPENVTTLQPKKKPRQRDLSEEEKQRNREISQQRVEIEHQMGGVKRCRIVSDIFRNRTDYYIDDVMETACGLHNFRLSHRRLRVS